MISRIVLITSFLFYFLVPSFGQHIFKGKVIDGHTKRPILYANVSIVGTTVGTNTDFHGNFMLDYNQVSVKLEFSYIGYETQIIDATPVTDLQIVLNRQIDKRVGTLAGVIVNRSPIEQTIPAPIFKTTSEMIRSNSGISPEPILNLTPGVLMHSGALNTNRITIRGIGNRSQFGTSKIRAYLDDIPLTTGVGETTIEDLDLSLFKSMRIWKGPAAVTNGVGLGGLIELQTTDAKLYKKSISRGIISSSLQLGSYGLIRNVNQLVFKTGKFFAVANAAITKSDGYRENNEYDRKSYSILGSYGNTIENKTTFFGNFTSLKAFIPSSLNRADYENEPKKAAFTWNAVKGFEDYDRFLLGVSHSHQLFYNSEKNINLYNITSIFTSNFDSYESRPFNILQENTLAFGGRTKFQLYKQGGKSNQKINFGIELFQDNYDWTTNVTNDGVLGNLLSDNEEKRNYYNAFAKYEMRHFKEFNLHAGINLNNTKYNLTDLFNPDSTSVSGDYSFASILSPQVGISYKIKRKYMVYVTASHGFSPPTLEETLTPDGQINPDIRPEQGWNFEIGTRYNAYNKINFDIALFSMHINDLLVADRIAEDQYVGINAGKTIHNGVEVFLNKRFKNFASDITYTFSDFKFDEFVDEDNDYSGNKLTGTPAHTLNVALRYEGQNAYANLNYRFVDKMPMRDDNSIYSEAFNVVNTKVGYKKDIGRFILDVHAGVNNVLNQKYAAMVLINAGSFGGNAPRYYYPGMPTNFYGGVELRYRF